MTSDPWHNDLCTCDSMSGRFGAHRPDCPTAIAQAEDLERERQDAEKEEGEMTIISQSRLRRELRDRGLGWKQAMIGSAIACVEAPARKAGLFASDFSKVGDQKLADDKWGFSFGGFQVRSLREQSGTGGIRDAERLIEVEFNIDSAVSIFHAEGWEPWSTYTTGMFKALLPSLYPAAEGTYVVVPGDTLSTIAERIGGFPWQEWARVNNLHDPWLLRIGDVLMMPS